MRYQNWDVLLFQTGSNVPIQEFRTQCCVTRDDGMCTAIDPLWYFILPPITYDLPCFTDSPYLRQTSVVNPLAYGFPSGNVGQLPTLTSFVPSLPHNTAFSVSIHSWDNPQPSSTLLRRMNLGDAVTYSAGVVVDGVVIAYVSPPLPVLLFHPLQLPWSELGSTR